VKPVLFATVKNTTLVSLLDLDNRYGGLTYTSQQIGHYFIKSKYYIEVFSGLARTAKYARATHIILNDISDYANKKNKKSFRDAIITNMDFIECIKLWNFKDSFFLIDPPWRISYYNITNRKTAKQYLKDLEEILPIIKGTYIVTLDKGIKIKSPYTKLITHTHSRLFGHKPRTRLFSNKPLEIRIPTLDSFC
jgi:hypothetical protein